MLAKLPVGGTLPEAAWRHRHRGVVTLLWLHAVAVPVVAMVRGYSLTHAALESVVVPLAAVVANNRHLSTRARTLVASLGLLSCSAILVHLSGGLIEMHFHFFVMIVVVSLYQDWLPFLAAVAFVLLHHGVGGALDPDAVFNHPAAINAPWRWAAIHALFIAGISAAALVNWRLSERHLQEAGIAEQRLTAEIRLVERLSDVGGTLVADLDPDRVVQRVVDLATQLTAAEVGAFLYRPTADTGEGSLRVVLSGLRQTRHSVPTTIDDLAPLPAAFRRGAVVRIDDVLEQDGTDLRALSQWLLEATGGSAVADGVPVRSCLLVPVVARSEVFGWLVFLHGKPGQFSAWDERAATGIAAHAAVAVENARVYSVQRAAASTLQQSLLPDRLPVVPGLSIAARYLPAGAETDVGGDWYDVFILRDGTVGLVMGDVVGRGLPAAALMGQLRNALRAYALEGYPPAVVLDRLNDLACALDVGFVATVVFVALDPTSGEARMATAGHLPVLLIGTDGTAAFVRSDPGVPLGVLDVSSYTETVVRVPCGCALAFYTDGLVEDRSTSLDVGLERLRRAVFGSPPDPHDMCDHILQHGAIDGASTDDTALLIVRRDAVPARAEVGEAEDPALAS